MTPTYIQNLYKASINDISEYQLNEELWGELHFISKTCWPSATTQYYSPTWCDDDSDSDDEANYTNISDDESDDAETENDNTVHPTGDSTDVDDWSDENDIDVSDDGNNEVNDDGKTENVIPVYLTGDSTDHNPDNSNTSDNSHDTVVSLHTLLYSNNAPPPPYVPTKSGYT